MLALWVIVITALLASVSIFLLLKSSLQANKKQKILLIVGVLIFISIVISNFKSRHIIQHFSQLLASTRDQEYERISDFYHGDIHVLNNEISEEAKKINPNYFMKKFNNIEESDIGDELFLRNYGTVEHKDYSQRILYVSQKGDGASYFMQQLASRIRNIGIPAFYIKIQIGGKEFFRKTGFKNAIKFRESIGQFHYQGKAPYIIIDNAQNLPCKVWLQLFRYSKDNQIKLVLNTERLQQFVDKISEIPLHPNEQTPLSFEQFFLSFEFRSWIGPSTNILRSFNPTNSYVHQSPNKNTNFNFYRLSQMKDGITEQEITLKASNAHNIIAGYYDVLGSYTKIKRLIQEKSLNIVKSTKQIGGGRSTQINRSSQGGVFYSLVRKSGIRVTAFEKLESIGLVELSNGIVYLN